MSHDSLGFYTLKSNLNRNNNQFMRVCKEMRYDWLVLILKSAQRVHC